MGSANVCIEGQGVGSDAGAVVTSTTGATVIPIGGSEAGVAVEGSTGPAVGGRARDEVGSPASRRRNGLTTASNRLESFGAGAGVSSGVLFGLSSADGAGVGFMSRPVGRSGKSFLIKAQKIVLLRVRL